MLGLNLKIIVDVVPMSWAAMILPKNSLLTAMFREDILWLHERGIMQDLMLKWKGGVIGTNNDFEKSILVCGSNSTNLLCHNFGLTNQLCLFLWRIFVFYPGGQQTTNQRNLQRMCG